MSNQHENQSRLHRRPFMRMPDRGNLLMSNSLLPLSLGSRISAPVRMQPAQTAITETKLSDLHELTSNDVDAFHGPTEGDTLHTDALDVPLDATDMGGGTDDTLGVATAAAYSVPNTCSFSHLPPVSSPCYGNECMNAPFRNEDANRSDPFNTPLSSVGRVSTLQCTSSSALTLSEMLRRGCEGDCDFPDEVGASLFGWDGTHESNAMMEPSQTTMMMMDDDERMDEFKAMQSTRSAYNASSERGAVGERNRQWLSPTTSIPLTPPDLLNLYDVGGGGGGSTAASVSSIQNRGTSFFQTQGSAQYIFPSRSTQEQRQHVSTPFTYHGLHPSQRVGSESHHQYSSRDGHASSHGRQQNSGAKRRSDLGWRSSTVPALLVAIINNKAGDIGIAMCHTETATIEVLQFGDTVLYSKTMSYLFSAHFKYCELRGRGATSLADDCSSSNSTTGSTATRSASRYRRSVASENETPGGPATGAAASSSLSSSCEFLVPHTTVDSKLVQTLLKYFGCGGDPATEHSAETPHEENACFDASLLPSVNISGSSSLRATNWSSATPTPSFTFTPYSMQPSVLRDLGFRNDADDEFDFQTFYSTPTTPRQLQNRRRTPAATPLNGPPTRRVLDLRETSSLRTPRSAAQFETPIQQIRGRASERLWRPTTHTGDATGEEMSRRADEDCGDAVAAGCMRAARVGSGGGSGGGGEDAHAAFPVCFTAVHRRHFNEAKGAKRLLELMSASISLEKVKPSSGSARTDEGYSHHLHNSKDKVSGVDREETIDEFSTTMLEIMDPAHYLCCAAANALLYVLDTAYADTRFSNSTSTGTANSTRERLGTTFIANTVRVRYVSLDNYMELNRQTARAMHIIPNHRLEQACRAVVNAEESITPKPSLLQLSSSIDPTSRRYARHFTPQQSLVEAVDFTHSPMGRRMLRGSIVQPLRDPRAIDARYDCVSLLVHSESAVKDPWAPAASEWESVRSIGHTVRPTDLLRILRQSLRPFSVEDDFERVLALFSTDKYTRDAKHVESRLLACVSLWVLLRATIDVRDALKRVLPMIAARKASTNTAVHPSRNGDIHSGAGEPHIGVEASALPPSATPSSCTATSFWDTPACSCFDCYQRNPGKVPPARLLSVIFDTIQKCELESLCEQIGEYLDDDVVRMTRAQTAAGASAAGGEYQAQPQGPDVRGGKRRKGRSSVSASISPALRQVQLCFLVKAHVHEALDRARDHYSAAIESIMTHCNEVRRSQLIPSLRIVFDAYRQYHFCYDSRHEAQAAAATLWVRDHVTNRPRREPLLIQAYSGGTHFGLHVQHLLDEDSRLNCSGPQSAAHQHQQQQQSHVEYDADGTRLRDARMHSNGTNGEWNDSDPRVPHVLKGRKVFCTTRQLLLLNHQVSDLLTALVFHQFNCIEPLLAYVRSRIGQLQSCCEAIGLLDMLCSFATFSVAHDCVRPKLVSEGRGTAATEQELKERPESSPHEESAVGSRVRTAEAATTTTTTTSTQATKAIENLALSCFLEARQPTAGSTRRGHSSKRNLLGLQNSSTGEFGASVAVAPKSLFNEGTPSTIAWGTRADLVPRRRYATDSHESVPITSGDNDNRLLLITGPNASGKSTVLRLMGQLFCLAQAGCFVPSDSAVETHRSRGDPAVTPDDGSSTAERQVFHTCFSPCDVLLVMSLCDVPESAGVSSFQREVQQLRYVLTAASRNSVVLIDELGRRTTTREGSALAWATAEHLAYSIRCRSAFVTHYPTLTRLEFTAPPAPLTVTAPSSTNDSASASHPSRSGDAVSAANYHLVVTAERSRDEQQQNAEGLQSKRSRLDPEAVNSSSANGGDVSESSAPSTGLPKRTLLSYASFKTPVSLHYSYGLVRGSCNVDHYGISLAKAVGFFDPALKRAEAIIDMLSVDHEE